MKKLSKILALVLTCALCTGIFGGCLVKKGSSQTANTGNLNGYGFVASSDKYTFVIRSSNEHNGDGNGSFERTGIYRINNKKGSDPELIYSEPAAVRYGTAGGFSVAFMAYGAGRLYFLSIQSDGIRVRWITPDGKQTGTADIELGTAVRRLPVCDGSGYYVFGRDPDYVPETGSEDTYRYEAFCWYRVDMKTGKAAKFTPPFLSENEVAVYFASADGYLYFAKYYSDAEKIDKGLYRARSGDKKAEGIAEIDPDLLEDIETMAACGNDLWYVSNSELHYIDIATGKDTLLVDDVTGNPLNTSGDGMVWYADRQGRICRTDKEGTTEAVYSADPDKAAIYFAGDQVFLISRDLELYATEKDARITPSKPFFPKMETSYETSGDWSYETNGKYARIYEYTGSDSEVVIPTELDGKKVTMVSFLVLPETAVKLTVPEGVYFVYEVRGKNLKEIELPASLDVIGEGQNFTFRFCPLLEKVSLNAKMDHWDEIIAAYETMYAGQGIDAAGEANTGYTLYCTDGRIVVTY